MSPILEALLVLQSRDQRVKALETDIARLPAEKIALEQRAVERRAAFEKLRLETRQIEADRKKLEIDVQTKQGQIARYKQQQYETRKNEEYTALSHEIERTEKAISVLEDQELDLMGRYEDAQKTVAAAEVELKAFEVKNAANAVELQKRHAVVEKELVEAKTQQAEAEGKVEEAPLARYRRILTSKKDSAIVPLRHGVCSGCHMKVTAQTAVTARGDTLTACDSCGRLVFADD